jgi:SAM-dependent methyltransferase/uncharacterized protein YbaR (Trm112 family)
MRREFLKLMKCPYCGGNIEIDEVYEEKNKGIINGVVKCACGEYPILHGILNFKINPLSKYALELLKEGEPKEALMLLLGPNVEGIWELTDFLQANQPGRLFRKVLLTLVGIWAKQISKRYLKEDLSFCDLLGKNPNQAYFKHRFSAETLWSVYPFIPLLKRNRKRILDLGCGRGHASFIISAYVEPEELVCADHTFKSLYLASKYFVKETQFICLDGNYPLPFKDHTFDSVFMLDALHYIQTRAQLANELKRVVSPEGLLLLLHLHNSLVYNIGAGYPLTHQAWINLFKGGALEIKAIPERRIVENFLLNNELDLAEEYSENELNASNAISIIASKEKSLFGVYDRVDSYFLNKNNLVINPIYKMKEEGDKILLRRNFPSEFFRKEYPLTEKYLPERSEIDKRFVNGRSVCVSDSDEIEDLMRKIVIINVPEKYMKV